MIYVVMEVAFVVFVVAMVILMVSFNRKKINKLVAALSIIVVIISVAVIGIVQSDLNKILVNSAVIERNGEYVRVSPYYSEEYIKSACGKEYYIPQNGIDSMLGQIFSKIFKTSPYIE